MSKLSTTLAQGLEDLRKRQSYTDFVIISEDNVKIPCHRVILAAVSPFFDTMFNSDMQVYTYIHSYGRLLAIDCPV